MTAGSIAGGQLRTALLALVTLFGACACWGVEAQRAIVGPADFAPVLPPASEQTQVHVPAFRLDRAPVTNEQFLEFVRSHPVWRRDRVASLFADGEYLSHWTGPDQLGAGALAHQPVTRVSWYAARSYCAAVGARLPTWNEWELASAADEKTLDARSSPTWRARILDWYSRPGSEALREVGLTPADVHGIHDLHGLIWEWVEDFNSLMVSGDSRTQGDPDKLAFCGSGALSAQDRENYPVLMRIAFLSSLEARSTGRMLGFRCANAAEGAAPPVMEEGAVPQLTADGAVPQVPSDSLYQMDVPLQSSDGAALTLSSLRGKPLLITLFYDSCTSVCPMLTAQLQNVERQLSPQTRHNLTFLMVSLDPDRDTPEALTSFRHRHHVEASNWIVTRTSAEHVRVLAAALGVRYRELPDHSFNHSTVITLADEDGVVRARSVGPQSVDTTFLRTLQAIAGGRAASRRGGG